MSRERRAVLAFAAMKHRFTFAALLLAGACSAGAATPASPDYSGVYDCKGVDKSEGPYTATVNLDAVPAQSENGWRSYNFKMDVPGYGIYRGQAVSRGNQLAIHFALDDPGPKDFGTGLATVSTRGGRTTYTKFYYEPEFKGGNHGTETCVRR